MIILTEILMSSLTNSENNLNLSLQLRDRTNNNSTNVIWKSDELVNINQNEVEWDNDLTIETKWTENLEEVKDKNRIEDEVIGEQKGDNKIDSFFWDSSSKVKFREIERDFNKLLISFVTNPFDFVEETMQVENSAQKLANTLTVTRWISKKLPKYSNIDTKPFKKSHSLNYEKQMKHKKIKNERLRWWTL